LTIDPQEFAAGQPPEQFLVWPTQTPDADTKQQADAFLQGLPSLQYYRRGNVRYLETPLRNDAFECRLAAAQIPKETDPANEQSCLFRVDAWLTAAVPFGVLQFEQTVKDADTAEILNVRRFTAVASSRSFAEKQTTKPTATTGDKLNGLNIPAN
jgi:hypothetical protein